GFAQAHTTMNDQRVERLAGCMDHLSRCGVCQLIAWPRHEVVKKSRQTDGSRYSRKSRTRSLAVHRVLSMVLTLDAISGGRFKTRRWRTIRASWMWGGTGERRLRITWYGNGD